MKENNEVLSYDKILVIGANGYLGTGVGKQLCDDGQTVVAACHSRTDIVDIRAEIKQCDIYDIDNPYEYFGKPDVLLHMAWRNGFVHNDYSHLVYELQCSVGD